MRSMTGYGKGIAEADGKKITIEIKTVNHRYLDLGLKFPKTFMWHTFEDGAVPLENSLLFARALKEHAVNFEYHVFPHGGHGYALGTKETTMESGKEIDPQIPAWRNLCAKWLEVNF